PIGETAPPQAPVADLPVPPIPVVDAPVSEVPTVGSRSGVAPVARVVTNVPNGAPATVPAAVPERAPVTVPAGVGDGVDRSDMGGAVTRTGLSGRLEDPFVSRRLARRMIDGEIAPGGRISDPRDVSGIVLALASDVPASIAVSVVRIDEELEIVGDSIDPSIDPALLSTAFSGVFRNVRPAAEILEVGVLGQIQDVIIAGEHVDLILRPLGDRYFLMVLEDRHDARSDLTATRHRMETIAPGLTAMLAQQDGEG
ncbi:MAG: hypothetical protein JST73_01650, partial [Actinobacteria bacterium]|nr:hypothetical protein [Actinomycetota bacterium]